MTAASNSDARKRQQARETTTDLPDVFFALDGDDEPTLWLRRPLHPSAPKALIRKCDVGATASISTLLDRPMLRDRPRRDVAVALAWIACESSTQTPARVLESGPWWQAAGVQGTDNGGAVTTGYHDPASNCDICQQPAHRHTPTSGHEFVSALDAARRRDTTPKPRLPRTKENR